MDELNGRNPVGGTSIQSYSKQVMKTVDLFLLIYAGILIVLSFVNLLGLDYWWIRIWDFPHLQLSVLALTGLVSWGLLSRESGWPMIVVPIGLFTCLVYQCWLIYPFTPLAQKQLASLSNQSDSGAVKENTIKLLVANVLMDNEQVGEIVSMVDQYEPDIVLLLEPDQHWEKGLKSLESSYPHRILYPLDNTYGMLLYSRLPIKKQEVRFLIQKDIPSMYAQLELPSGQLVHFYGVHPMPPSPTEHYRSTERDAELLLVAKEAREQQGPVLVAGDLNDVAWSHTTRLFQRISGLLDPRIGRGLYNTYNADYFFMRWPLDHIFVSQDFQIQEIRRLADFGSDHFPIFTSLTYTGSKMKPKTEVPTPDHDDIKEARKTIKKAG